MARRKPFQVESPRIVPANHGTRRWVWFTAIVALIAWTLLVYWYASGIRPIVIGESDPQAMTLLQRITELEQERDRLLEQAASPEDCGPGDPESEHSGLDESGPGEATQEQTPDRPAEGSASAAPPVENAAPQQQQAAPADARSPVDEEELAESNPVSLATVDLMLRDLKLQAVDGEDRFNYSFVLARPEKGTDKVTGEASVIAVGGSMDDTGPDGRGNVTPIASRTHKLGFRHFQELTGQLDLPTGASPETLLIEIALKTPENGRFRESYPWSQRGD